MQLREPKRTTIDFAALQAAADQHAKEQTEAAKANLKAIREKARSEQQIITTLGQKAADQDREAKRREAEREAEEAAETAKQAVLDKYKAETQQDERTEAYKGLVKKLRPTETE